MKRKNRVKQKAREIVEAGERPSAARLSSELDWPEQDVHRCLNSLEKEGEVSTYGREVLGKKYRMVGLNR
ncbi:MAG: hypothetical protein ABEJ75_01545 [Candidatus Nanohaloarchaea archaeon]